MTAATPTTTFSSPSPLHTFFLSWIGFRSFMTPSHFTQSSAFNTKCRSQESVEEFGFYSVVGRNGIDLLIMLLFAIWCVHNKMISVFNPQDRHKYVTNQENYLLYSLLSFWLSCSLNNKWSDWMTIILSHANLMVYTRKTVWSATWAAWHQLLSLSLFFLCNIRMF